MRIANGLLPGLFLLSLTSTSAGQEFESPFYPLKLGSEWVYQSGKQTVRIRVTHKDALEFKKKDKEGNETVTKVNGARLEVSSGDRALVEQVAVLMEGVFRFSSAGKEIEPPLLFLRLPFNKSGESWECQSTSKGFTLKGAFTSREDMIKVPAGEFRAIHVSCPDFEVGEKKMAIDYWFAQDVGLVKQRVKIGNNESLLELKEYKPGK